MIAMPEMLDALEPGELIVRILRDGWSIPPDHIARTRASQALCHFNPTRGSYRSTQPNAQQTECLEGAA